MTQHYDAYYLDRWEVDEEIMEENLEEVAEDPGYVSVFVQTLEARERAMDEYMEKFRRVHGTIEEMEANCKRIRGEYAALIKRAFELSVE